MTVVELLKVWSSWWYWDEGKGFKSWWLNTAAVAATATVCVCFSWFLMQTARVWLRSRLILTAFCGALVASKFDAMPVRCTAGIFSSILLHTIIMTVIWKSIKRDIHCFDKQFCSDFFTLSCLSRAMAYLKLPCWKIDAHLMRYTLSLKDSILKWCHN